MSKMTLAAKKSTVARALCGNGKIEMFISKLSVFLVLVFVLTSPVLGQSEESKVDLQQKLELIMKQINTVEKRLLDIKTQIGRLKFEAIPESKVISDKVIRDPAAIFRQQPQFK